jgi:hypothetical protein
MKTPVLAVIIVVAGIAVGSGAAFGTGLVLGKQHSGAAAKAEVAAPPTFVPTGKILAPLVFPGGRLAGYVSIEAQFEVPEDKVEFVRARLPLLLHAVNMRTYRTPMTSGPDGMLPDLAVFRTVLMAAAGETFGPGVVSRAAITQATPA